MARRAAVATGHPLATSTALRVLFEGGNAVDATIAAAAVLAVVLPDMCGLGGDAFALVFDPSERRVWALNGSGPASITGQLPGNRPREFSGAQLATVPGAVLAWADLLERFGSKAWDALLQPAAGYAAEGFPIGVRLSDQIARHAHVLWRDPAAAAIFLAGDRPPPAGSLLRQLDLARSLRLIAENGPSVLYTGELAVELTDWLGSHGGLLTSDDFTAQHSIWAEPLVGEYRGLSLHVSPPVSQAAVLLLELATLVDDDLASLGPDSAEAIHLMVEAKKAAFALRDRYLGDPAYAPGLPVEALTAAAARRRRGSIGRLVSPRGTSAESPTHANTTYLAVVDQDGMAVSFIQSIFNDWGCGSIAGRTGIFLNDRLLGFSWDPASPNHIAPGKRPLHTLSPCIGIEGDELRLVIGTPGADAQVQTLMQLLVNLLDHGMDLQTAIEAPRWRSMDRTTLLLERRLSDMLATDLESRGHTIRWGEAWDTLTGGAQAVWVDRPAGVLHAAADPRREGTAAGY